MSEQHRPAPHDLLHWEDLEVGRTVTFGSKVVTTEDIVTFARAFDPQPFHLSEEAARGTRAGRLIASGFHSCAMLMRMYADHVLNAATSLGSPGIEDVRWLQPVLPGSRLSGRYTCRNKRLLKSRPGVGLAKLLLELVDDRRGEPVMTWDSAQLLRVRNPAADPAAGA
jgi:acyl dehydratase